MANWAETCNSQCPRPSKLDTFDVIQLLESVKGVRPNDALVLVRVCGGHSHRRLTKCQAQRFGTLLLDTNETVMIGTVPDDEINGGILNRLVVCAELVDKA